MFADVNGKFQHKHFPLYLRTWCKMLPNFLAVHQNNAKGRGGKKIPRGLGHAHNLEEILGRLA
jgi:hypothetical protein